MKKTCKTCREVLDISNFFRNKNLKDGYENECKKCRLERKKKYMNTCITCGEKFKTAYKESKYCSQKCKPQSQRKRIKVKCSICGIEKEITPSYYNSHKDFYCSDECKNKGYSLKYSGENNKKYNKVKVKCEMCGKVFKRNPYEVNRYKHNYCSKKCQQEGYKFIFNGENNPNYNPNKTDEERIIHRNIDGYNEWRRCVYERDKYTCQCCGDNKGHNLNAHHIFNYSEYENLRTNINNGITLCDKCHKLYHDIYGYRHNNYKELNEFLNRYKIKHPKN